MSSLLGSYWTVRITNVRRQWGTLTSLLLYPAHIRALTNQVYWAPKTHTSSHAIRHRLKVSLGSIKLLLGPVKSLRRISKRVLPGRGRARMWNWIFWSSGSSREEEPTECAPMGSLWCADIKRRHHSPTQARWTWNDKTEVTKRFCPKPEGISFSTSGDRAPALLASECPRADGRSGAFYAHLSPEYSPCLTVGFHAFIHDKYCGFSERQII